MIDSKRPVGNLCSTSKIFERLILNRIAEQIIIYIAQKNQNSKQLPTNPSLDPKINGMNTQGILNSKKEALISQLQELKLEEAKFQTDFRKFSGEQPTWFAHSMQKCDNKSALIQVVTPISLFLTLKKSSPLFYPLTAAVTFFGLL